MENNLKIVHCANFSESKNGAVYYSIDRKITNGLIRNNHFVYDFSYREVARSSSFFKSKKRGAKKMNKALIQTIENIQPDLLLLGHSEIIYIDTLKEIKSKFPNIKIMMWWVDPLINISHIYKRLQYLDSFFATTAVSKLINIFGDNNQCKFYYMPNMCDASIESYKSYERIKKKFDLLFVGRYDDERKEFIDYLKSNFNDLEVGIYGNSKDNIILGQAYFDLLLDTKIGINYSRFNDIELYSSDRIIQLMASGICTFSPRIPDMKLLFNENEIVYFDDFEDFKKKVYFYLANDEQRDEIAQNGYNKAQSSYNSTRVSKFMIETLYGKFSEKYEWMGNGECL